MRAICAAVVAVFIFAVTSSPASAGRGADTRMVQAGFVMRSATTPQKLARMKKLPRREFIERIKPAGRYYVYSDPDYCKCVFVGNELAMRTYQDMRKGPPPSPRHVKAGGISTANWLVRESQGSDVFDDAIFAFPY